MSNKRRLIEDIKNEYLSEKNKKQTTIKSMWSQYQKMGKELSEGIYAEDNHFIYELIQNAEDTKSNEKLHTLEFTLENNGLIVFNNEVGFTEEQIKAICSFGQSTKALEKNEGFIGEKGIGFKSVFKITDKPAIFSNGYRFYFNKLDESETTTEYIIPHWIDDNELKKYPLQFQNNTHTTLYLPFSKEKKQEKIDKLKEDIKHIEPILLLFLKKLTNIKINESGQKVINTKKTSKKDENLELVTIQNKDTLDRYYIFKKSIDVNQNLDEVKDKNGRRKDIEKREVILAFPDFKNKIKEDRIFSFLPTKLHSELNFIIQADFILQSGRENIAIDNEWNQWQFAEIEELICDEIVDKLKSHTKLKFSYLNYFIKNGNSHNKLIETLYKNIINRLKDNFTILSDNETWQKPNNIILLEDNIKINTKYLKLLLGDNYEQVHEKFKLDNYFISKFNIERVNKEKLLNQIFIYLDKYNELNSYNTDDVFYLTKIISKYLNFGRDGRKFDEDYLKKIKKSLPIIPKYKTDKKFYLFDVIYISSEYKPKFLIENIAKEDEFDFTKYNFLSDNYLKDKRLTDFIKNIIDEQEKNKNKKTVEFFTKYSDILQNYLQNDIKNRYKKILNFLIEIQEDNKDKISKIPLLLTQNSAFYNSTATVYFSNDSDSNLDILDKNLFELIHTEHKYKEFLEKIFKVKEADILNIILNEYLPWIGENYQQRTPENDVNLLKYTKDIMENFDKFEQNEKQNIKNRLYFISSNQENKYLKSSNIYLSQNLTEIIFNSDSIEKYITDKSYFDFLNDNYNSFISIIDEKKVKDFFSYFSFEKYIKENDIPSFIKFMKQDLDLDLNIEALEFIAKSINIDDKKKIKDIENFKIYSQNNNLLEVKNIFQVQVDNLKIDYIHTSYKEKISDLYFKNIKQYFQSENKIESFINYLKKDINFDEAVKVYQYLDSKSNFDPNIKQNYHYTITTEKIRKEFKNSKLIYNNSSDKFYPTDVTWKEEKSANKLFALSAIYPQELQNFFIKKVQVSQSRDIKQIVNQIKEIKEKSDDYFDLLIDLNDLVVDDSELDKYSKSFNSSIHEQYDKNIYENIKQFILKKEQIFILDNGKKNSDNNFYFNDLDICNIDEKIESKLFTVSSKYPIEHYNDLVNTLKIKRLSNIEKTYANRQFIENYNIQNYRFMLNFTYDLVFTKFPDEYKKLEDREVDLKELNLINTINVHQDIVSQIILDGIRIELNGVKYYFKKNELFIVNKNELFKIIAKKIDSISDKDIKDFYNEVIGCKKTKEQYYKDENIKERQNFTLEISNETVENTKTDITNENDFNIDENSDNGEKDTESDNKQNNDQSAEDERKDRQNTDKNIGDHDTDYDELDEEINPDIINPEKHKENLEKSANEKQIREDSKKAEENISNKISSDSKTKILSNTKSKIEEKNINHNSQSSNDTYSYSTKQSNITIIKDDYIKEKLYSEYKGYCQICAFTFVKSEQKNSFEAFNWTDRRITKNADRKIIFANSLSLCRNCAANIRFGQFKSLFLNQKKSIKEFKTENIENIMQKLHNIIDENIPEKFQSLIEFGDMYGLAIELNNKERNIYFTPKHYVEFIALMQGE